ncbi:MAG: hypothetical protein FJ086_03215 [Deltaproteobacteria bacterium]|nr:hypothetical protein [Deltaproteobacteria bacterium]
MNSLLLLAASPHQGWLTTKLLGVTTSSAEWVLWLLAGLSVISLGLVLERTLYFSRNQLAGGNGWYRAASINFDASHVNSVEFQFDPSRNGNPGTVQMYLDDVRFY